MIRPIVLSIAYMFFIVSNAWAAPSVSSVTSPAVHGSSMIISGSSFGTKSPAEPFFWKNFEDQTVDSTTSVTSMFDYAIGISTPSCAGGLAGDGRIMFKNSSSNRWITPAHSRSTKILGGSHTDFYPSSSCNNSHVTVNDSSTHDQWVVYYYKRYSPEFPRIPQYYGRTFTEYNSYVITLSGNIDSDDSPITVAGAGYTKIGAGDRIRIDSEHMNVVSRTGTSVSVSRGYGGTSAASHTSGATITLLTDTYNHKEGSMESGTSWFSNPDNQIYGGTHFSGSPEQFNYYIDEGHGGVLCDGLTGADVTPEDWGIQTSNDMIDEWKHVRMLVNESARGWVEARINNVVSQTGQCTNAGDELVTNGDVYGFTLGSYFFTDPAGSGSEHRGYDYSWWYLDDLYIDYTFSRIELCDSATYSSATVCEPQPPVSWSDSSIEVTTNLGALSGSTVYLFVFDSTNAVNTSGSPVSLSSTNIGTISNITIGPGVSLR